MSTYDGGAKPPLLPDLPPIPLFMVPILTMSEQMRGLTENLLELARMDNRKQNKQFEVVSLSEIAANAPLPEEDLKNLG